MGEGTVFTGVCHSFSPRGSGREVGVWSEVGVVCSGGRGQEADTPRPEMATAAVGTHPTEMHSCSNSVIASNSSRLHISDLLELV